MSDFGSRSAALEFDNLADLITAIGNGLGDMTNEAQHCIDALVHQAAVQLMNALLPAMVHGKNAVTRSTQWMSAEATTLDIRLHLAGADVSNTVLAGLVAEKVEQGVAHITSDLDYADAVNSIT